MKVSDLEDYETRERSVAREFGPQAVLSGFVSDAAKIYQDVPLPRRLGFARSGSPLSALILLYETTVLYFPPAGLRELEARYRLSWNDMLSLIESRSIMPIIGHPTHYARKAHFDDLFAFSPPSVWARGDELARKFAGADAYWDIARSELAIPEMVRAPWLRTKFKRQFPNVSERSLTERIEIELITNFVDLCIHGWEPVVLDLARQPDREYAARRIIELSELLTYPTLIGMGGTPNYAFASDLAISQLADGAPPQYADTGAKDVGDLAKLLVTGLDLSFPGAIDTDLIAQFHSDDMSTRLWAALEALEDSLVLADDSQSDDSQDTVSATADRAEHTLIETLREVRSPGFRGSRSRSEKRTRLWVDLTMKVGTASGLTVSTGALGLDWVAAAGLGTALASATWPTRLFDASIGRVEASIQEFLMTRRSGALATQVWWLSDWRSRAQAGR